MKAYQVFSGDLDKYDDQYYDLQATYLNKQHALEHCEQIVAKDIDGKDAKKIEKDNWVAWIVEGWHIVTICKMEEIEITE